MAERGFLPDDGRRLCWRKDGDEATAFVSLQRQSFSKGWYVNYNLAFNRLAAGHRPMLSETIATGRNPACFREGKIRMHELLDGAAVLQNDRQAQAEFIVMLDQQIAALLRLASVKALIRRLEEEPPLDMYVMTKYLAEIEESA